MFSKKCKEHFDDVGMTRWEHFLFAWKILIKLILSSIALFIHSFIPCLFKTYASDKIKEMNEIIKEHNND